MVWEQLLVEALTSDNNSDQTAKVKDLNISTELVRLNIQSEIAFVKQILDQFESYQTEWNELSDEDRRELKEDLKDKIDVDDERGDLERSEYYSRFAENKYLLSATYQAEGMISTKVYEANLDKLSLLTSEERFTIISFYSHLETLKNLFQEFKELADEESITRRKSLDVDVQMKRESLKRTIETHLEACQENCENAINLLKENS